MICDSAQAITFCLVSVVSSEDISLIRPKYSVNYKCSEIIRFQRESTFKKIPNVSLNSENHCKQRWYLVQLSDHICTVDPVQYLRRCDP